MSSVFHKAIDRCALHALHKTRSKDYQFRPVPESVPEPSEPDDFYDAGATPNIAFDLHRRADGYNAGMFAYRSLMPSGDPSNDTMSGEAFVHPDEAAPNVIFVHGWRMSSLDRIKRMFQRRLTDELGWNSYYLTLPYHFRRKPERSLYSGEYMISADIGRTIRSVRQAVVDLRALIRWMKTNKRGPVVVIGVSLGGFVTNLTATVEPDIDAMVSIFYANRLSYSIWNTIPGKHIKADLEHHGMTYASLARSWKITEPSAALPKMSKDRILLLSAKHDLYVHREDADLLWESWDRPKRYVYNCGHAGIVLRKRTIARDALSFVRQTITDAKV
ncbi:alpha/beta hydrolase [Paenibacillus sp. GYB003]|uniref:alpha/beta hydrolase n=1 Tax=Paenibacillus sp. GYB003 TaxID=2994392 RepID=UPI002F96943E